MPFNADQQCQFDLLYKSAVECGSDDDKIVSLVEQMLNLMVEGGRRISLRFPQT